MAAGEFMQATIITFATNVLSLFMGVGASVILARVLGPEGQGIYILAILLTSLIVTFGNLGIGPATVYYVARGEFRRQEILGNNILLSLGIGSVGVLAGLVVVLLFRETVFPNVSLKYLLLALVLVPLELFFSYVNYVLLGAQRIKEFNRAQVTQAALFLGFVAFALLGLRSGVGGAILAGVLSWLVADVLVFRVVRQVAGGTDVKPSFSYLKRAAIYGIQAHLANILGFLNYRVDMFLVNAFLGPVAVGLYSIAVGLVEKLWMVSFAASTVLFPRVAAETEEQRQEKFTPLVARTVLWITGLGALALALLSRWIVLLLYSEAFLPAVGALQALLAGIVALSAGRVLANDIAGRGFPNFNIYTGLAALVTNVVLNLLWIPRYGIVGAAWASTVAYTVSFLGNLFFYCQLSRHSWSKAVLFQRGDWALYLRAALASWQWMSEWVRTKIGTRGLRED
jgi:O-antigen/teichoic acid export membrane protein